MDPSNLFKSSTRPCKEAMKAKLRQMQAKLKQLLEPLAQRTEQQTKAYSKGLFRKCSSTNIDSVSRDMDTIYMMDTILWTYQMLVR